MKKAGFTLVELMGVLIIIGVLSLIIIPVTTNLIKEQKEKQYNQQIAMIELASKNFGTDNLEVLPSVDQEYIYITLGQLKSMGYLDQNIVNPITEKEISNCARVKITKTGNIYTYEYEVESENEINCTP